MIVTDEWAFVHIPKTSGTNFKHNVIKYNKNVVFGLPDKTGRGRLLQHQPLHRWEELLLNQKVFAIIRNPYARAASQWLYSINDKEFLSIYGKVSFIDYWGLSLDQTELGWNFTTNQVDFIKSNQGRVVKVFKLESELKLLEKEVKLNFTRTHINASPEYNYRRIYNKVSLQVINDLFDRDFIAFDYKKLN